MRGEEGNAVVSPRVIRINKPKKFERIDYISFVTRRDAKFFKRCSIHFGWERLLKLVNRLLNYTATWNIRIRHRFLPQNRLLTMRIGVKFGVTAPRAHRPNHLPFIQAPTLYAGKLGFAQLEDNRQLA